MRPPRSRTSRAACSTKMREAAPRHCGSDGGKCVPISPAPQVASSASVSACSADVGIGMARQLLAHAGSRRRTAPRDRRARRRARRSRCRCARRETLAPARQALVGHGDIPCPGEFHIVGRAGDDLHRHLRPFGDRRIVGKAGLSSAIGLLMRGIDRPEGKALRRLRGIEAVARHGLRRRSRRRRRASAFRRPAAPAARPGARRSRQ